MCGNLSPARERPNKVDVGPHCQQSSSPCGAGSYRTSGQQAGTQRWDIRSSMPHSAGNDKRASPKLYPRHRISSKDGFESPLAQLAKQAAQSVSTIQRNAYPLDVNVNHDRTRRD
ncbi:hypothetical protein QFC19_001528 [Naganishia cerealis]|uniref:Uncharacterized protein n=1 Tax=Naganishia cerealis TaxID=610337 RepID=A0ACC2WHR4_9TREE|nr:hypothetical protein QFC19_001528 [Naganishia cerealis]